MHTRKHLFGMVGLLLFLLLWAGGARAQTTITSQNFDASTSPPANWILTNPSNFAVMADATNAHSAPNCLEYFVNGGAGGIANYDVFDGNGGNVHLKTTIRYGTSIGTETDVMLRGRAVTYSSYYEARITLGPAWAANAGVALFRSTTRLTSAVGGSAFAAGQFYDLHLFCYNSTIQLAVQRLSDGFWLSSGGVFVSDSSAQTFAATATDSVITGVGKAAIFAYDYNGGPVCCDDFLFQTYAPPPISYSVTPPAIAQIGQAGTYTIQLSRAAATDSIITVSDATAGGAAGTLSPVSGQVTVTAGGLTGTFTYAPTGTAGVRTFHAVNNNALADPANTTLTALRVGAAYYVSAAGSDANNGTDTAHPWLTLGKITTNGIAPGDTYAFRGGDTFTGSVAYTGLGNLGTSGNRITFTSYGTGQATLAPPDNATDVLAFTNTGGVTVNALTFVGLNTAPGGSNTATNSAVHFVASGSTAVQYPYCSVASCAASGFRMGVLFDTAATIQAGWLGNSVTGCTVHDCWAGGVWSGTYGDALVRSSGTVVSDCLAYNIPGQTGGALLGQGIEVFSCASPVIQYNVVHDTGYSNTDGAGILTINCTAPLVQFNEVYRARGSTVDAIGIDLDWGTVSGVCQYNYVHDCEGGGLANFTYAGNGPAGVPIPMQSGNVYRYNIVQNCASLRQAGLWFQGFTINNTQVYNNTFVVTSASGSVIGFANSTTGTGFAFYNNAFITTAGGAFVYMATASPASLSWAKNAYWTAGGGVAFTYLNTAYSSIAAWGQDAGAITADPKLTAATTSPTIGNARTLALAKNAAPLLTSPLIDTGANLSTSYSISPGARDFLGRRVPSGAGYDVGAIEYLASVLFRSRSSGGLRAGSRSPF